MMNSGTGNGASREVRCLAKAPVADIFTGGSRSWGESLNRRGLCLASILGTALFLTALRVDAAQVKKVYRIGVLESYPDSPKEPWLEFVRELSRRGYLEGKNLVFERRFGNQLRPELVRKMAADLVALHVDLIYVPDGTLSALAAKNATKTIPIVFLGSADPVGMGLVESLSHPGGNLTGNSIAAFESFSKEIEFLSEVLNKLRRLVQLTLPGTRSLPWYPQMRASLTSASNRLGVSYESMDYAAVGEIEPLLKRFVREGIDAVSLIGSSGSIGDREYKEMANLLIAYKMPSIGDPDSGFLLSYKPDFTHLARTSAEYVDRILRGEHPADLPVEQTSTHTLVLNQRTAQAIGLKIPRSLLLRANRLIE